MEPSRTQVKGDAGGATSLDFGSHATPPTESKTAARTMWDFMDHARTRITPYCVRPSRPAYFFGACFWPVRTRPERDTCLAPPRAPFCTATDEPAFLDELDFRPLRGFFAFTPDFFCSIALPGRFDSDSAAASALHPRAPLALPG